MRLVMYVLLLWMTSAVAAPPQFAAVKAGHALSFPADLGAHPEFRTEWWYATGWLQTADKKPLGFQITFFRVATDVDAANPSQFAARQLLIAHTALSDPAVGKLLHDQQSVRQGFGLAYAATGNTDVKLDNWQLQRSAGGKYQVNIAARDYRLSLVLSPTQVPMLQGERGYSQKGAKPVQASYYYSEPQLAVSGSVERNGKAVAVTGTAWLDHEWSTSVLDAQAVGWDWLGANLDDGSALMAFQIRDKAGAPLWAHATLRAASGMMTQYNQHEVHFMPQRQWRSPLTDARYPVATQLQTGPTTWQLSPLMDDQELDTRQSTGAVYWEGAVSLARDGKAAGHGYLEMTGYFKALKFLR